MTQYLAVSGVQRGLARKSGALASGHFDCGTPIAKWQIVCALGAVYVAVSLVYGDVLTTRHDNRRLMSVLLPWIYLDGCLHYYFDGSFGRSVISRIARRSRWIPIARHLWQSAKLNGAGTMLLRQSLYFGLPIGDPDDRAVLHVSAGDKLY